MKKVIFGLMALVLVLPLAACGQAEGKAEATAPNHKQQKAKPGQQQTKKDVQKEKKQKKQQGKSDGKKIVITSDILQKIDKNFNTDLPFKQDPKYVVKRIGDPSWGSSYKNGMTIDDQGVMAGRLIKNSDGEKIEPLRLKPFQVRPYLRTMLTRGLFTAVLMVQDRILKNGMMSGVPLKSLEKIKKAKKMSSTIDPGMRKLYIEKMEKASRSSIRGIHHKLALQHVDDFPLIKQYFKKNITLFKKAVKGDYDAYLKAKKRGYLLGKVLTPYALKNIQFQ